MATTKQEALDLLLEEIQLQEGERFQLQEQDINLALQQESAWQDTLAIKILTILGGILSTVFSLAFLLLAGLYDAPAGMLFVGLLLITGATITLHYSPGTLLETACVSCHIMGYFLFGLGFSELQASDLLLSAALMLISSGVLLLTGNGILLFLSALILAGSMQGLIYELEAPYLMHLYTGLLAGLLSYLSFREASLIARHPRLNKAYGPVRMALVIALAATLVLLSLEENLLPADGQRWVSTLLLITLVLHAIRQLLRHFSVPNPRYQWLIYAFCSLLLSPSLFTPSIPGAILIILLSFYIGHRLSFALGLLSLIYFVVLFYYDLEMTLLLKSGIMLLSGLFFILAYWILHKILKNHVH